MSFDQLKREVALLDDQEKAELITFTLQLRYAQDPNYHREVNDRLNDANKSHWLTPDELEKRMGQA